jgi:hypothetical protein
MSTIVTRSSVLIFPLFFASIINQNRTNHYNSVSYFLSQIIFCVNFDEKYFSIFFFIVDFSQILIKYDLKSSEFPLPSLVNEAHPPNSSHLKRDGVAKRQGMTQNLNNYLIEHEKYFLSQGSTRVRKYVRSF